MITESALTLTKTAVEDFVKDALKTHPEFKKAYTDLLSAKPSFSIDDIHRLYEKHVGPRPNFGPRPGSGRGPGGFQGFGDMLKSPKMLRRAVTHATVASLFPLGASMLFSAFNTLDRRQRITEAGTARGLLKKQLRADGYFEKAAMLNFIAGQSIGHAPLSRAMTDQEIAERDAGVFRKKKELKALDRQIDRMAGVDNDRAEQFDVGAHLADWGAVGKSLVSPKGKLNHMTGGKWGIPALLAAGAGLRIPGILAGRKRSAALEKHLEGQDLHPKEKDFLLNRYQAQQKVDLAQLAAMPVALGAGMGMRRLLNHPELRARYLRGGIKGLFTGKSDI